MIGPPTSPMRRSRPVVDKPIRLTVELTQAQAWQFAQFLKRVSFREYRVNAQNEDEAYLMQYAGEKIRDALAEKGYAPR